MSLAGWYIEVRVSLRLMKSAIALDDQLVVIVSSFIGLQGGEALVDNAD